MNFVNDVGCIATENPSGVSTNTYANTLCFGHTLGG
jgi:hypothetical protein